VQAYSATPGVAAGAHLERRPQSRADASRAGAAVALGVVDLPDPRNIHAASVHGLGGVAIGVALRARRSAGWCRAVPRPRSWSSVYWRRAWPPGTR